MLKKITTFLKRNKTTALLLSVTWGIFFSPLIIAGRAYLLDDLKIIYYPMEIVYASFQHAWQLPQWSNLFGFGQPVLAWGQLGFFTPIHVLLRALYIPPVILLQLSIMIYFAIGLFGFFAFLKTQKLSNLASTLGAIIFTFSGFNIGHLNHVNFYTATMLLPWLLVAIHYFLQKPSIKKSVTIAIIGALITLSGQPQIVLYSFIIAIITATAIFLSSKEKKQKSFWVKIIWLSLLASILALGLASFAILPLKEFLPLTERNDALPEAEMFEFSYPPVHSITLIYPYLFGDHDNYWGAKGFQELAAYVGIIPLLLASLALFSYRKKNRTLRIIAIFLIFIGIAMALGKYSPIYRYLILNKILTNLTTPGRFVFFFDIGIAILAAIGFNNIQRRTSPFKISSILSSLLFPIILLAPSIYILLTKQADTFVTYITHSPATYLIIIGIISYFILFIPNKNKRIIQLLLIVTTITSLLYYSWSYNPRTSLKQALSSTPFTKELLEYSDKHGIPPRLYTRPTLLTSLQKHIHNTDNISQNFTVYQPITPHSSLPCLTIPMSETKEGNTSITIELKKTIQGQTLKEFSISQIDIAKSKGQKICFSIPDNQVNTDFLLSFSSSIKSNIRLTYNPEAKNRSVYFVRVTNPTKAQLKASKKIGQIVYKETSYSKNTDNEIQTIARHLNVPAKASSARWIGALSIKPYRDFIEFFFANDQEPYDGDGIHALQRYRKMFNLAGVTHLIQDIPLDTQDIMQHNNFITVAKKNNTTTVLKLYKNPEAFPKAFLVQNAIFKPANDEVRNAMSQDNFDPKQLIYINGPIPPKNISPPNKDLSTGTAIITHYDNTNIEVSVNTPTETWLVLTDATTPQWHTYIDGTLAPYYIADTVFKTAHIPSGKHTISFKYQSQAIKQSKIITIASLLVVIVLLLPFHKRLK